MIARLAVRNLAYRPWRSALLLVGYALGVGVMIVLLAIGEALLTQARDEKLVGGGAITVLPEGLDVEVMKTGGVGGLFFSIDHARFVQLQLLASPRLAADVRAVVGEGQPLRVLAVGPVPNEGYTWYRVNYDRLGVTGWAAGEFLAAPRAAAGEFGRFAEGWSAHGFGLGIAPDGQAAAVWRTYRWCGPGVAEPCDSFEGNLIMSGGQAAVAFARVEDSTAVGQVLASTDPQAWPVGAEVRLVLQPYGMAQLIVGGNGSRTLCGPRFAVEAPLAVRQSAPCGA